ncbi:putative polysaccharide synthase [Basidiobolus meristosporus CBS 931.73]|uniref:Putative polysaccharide synthase n=1 Tax=Basidiobolus meristosporus CBS 931.73 TaxID=1314790 RepID=A0A1Y1YLU1_9FUNG|nr:putative polysaccharide synthase [Basidiobolus meristosporus CBS 931.73]|eukprot:ORX98977.1 putative polysaccharide synthase [Basidiobolus meristosporus CBS 931.73]
MLYLTSDKFPVFVPFGIIGLYRYLWFLIKLSAWWVYKPIKPLPNPTYTAQDDVTIIVPTIDAGEEFKEAAHSWLANNPKEIIIITETKMLGPLQELADSVNPEKIKVFTVPKANKRLQMVEGIRHTTTEILVFADDDAIWPPTLLEYILACFEDPKMGGVGTSQRVKAVGKRQTVWEVLAGFRLTQRNIEVASSTHIDGGVCCLSGRTACYRTCILKDPAFIHNFTNDFWLGKYQLNSGDDKFLTRWVVRHGWNTYIQACPEAELLSTFKNNWRFLKQVLRWTRNTWRSDIRSLITERVIWYRYPFVAFTMLDKFFNPITLLAGPALVGYMCYKSVNPRTIDNSMIDIDNPHRVRGRPPSPNDFHLPIWNVLISYVVWLLCTRVIKLIPHFFRRPQDIIYVPAWLVFGYYFAIMKIYSLFTLHVTAWGTRQGVDTDPNEVLAEQKRMEEENLPETKFEESPHPMRQNYS